MNKLKNTANWLIKRLKKEGFIVQRYDSYSTNSIYLKLDYGTSNSIRISDHKGKKHLAYRYNILTVCPELIASRDIKGKVRYYFPIKSRDILLKKVLFDKRMLIEEYGQQSYQHFMEKNKQRGQTKKGFWQSAQIV